MINDTSFPKIQTILIIGPAWIGDMVMAQTLFKFLKSINPTIHIDVLAPSWTLPLVERMKEVRQGILFPFGHGELKLLKRYAFAKKLMTHQYDQAIVLPGSFKSALTAYWAKIPLRTGWLGEWRLGILNDVRRLTQGHYRLMIEQFVALGQHKDLPLTKDLVSYYPSLLIDKDNRQALLNRFELDTQTPIIALCPGAEYGPAKRWPLEYFAEVAKKMLSKGRQVWIFGSKKEKDLAQNLMNATDHQCIDLTGKTTLLEAIDLMSLAQGIICNDSGLMHIAAALGRPLVVLYGSSSPHFTPPLAHQVKIIHLNLECSPCFKRDCPLEHFHCMKKITPDLVLSNLTSLLNHDKNTDR